MFRSISCPRRNSPTHEQGKQMQTQKDRKSKTETETKKTQKEKIRTLFKFLSKYFKFLWRSDRRPQTPLQFLSTICKLLQNPYRMLQNPSKRNTGKDGTLRIQKSEPSLDFYETLHELKNRSARIRPQPPRTKPDNKQNRRQMENTGSQETQKM